LLGVVVTFVGAMVGWWVFGGGLLTGLVR